ncbi:MAG TPA: hypothetical protein VJJ02_01880 [Candidatus Paceibacterota bacterium]
MENEIDRKINALDVKIDAIYISVEKTRKYFFWTMMITLVVVVVPAIGLLFALPMFMNSYIGGMQEISGL